MIDLLSLCLVLAVQDSGLPSVAPTEPARALAVVESQESTEAKRRVLQLASGQSIRVLSRFVDERWEYKSKNGWKTLEKNAVVSATLESELLAAWNAKRSTPVVRDAVQRAQLADWAAGVGLTTEALSELEAALAQDPDSIAARETLQRHWFFTVPSIRVDGPALAAAEEELLRFGASQTSSGRELAATELARHPDKAALKSKLASELHSKVVVRRSFAALALRRIFPGEEIKALILRSVFDASADVRRGCALGLKAANDPAVCVPIVRALNSKLPIVRANAAEALGSMGYAAAVEPLVAALVAPQSGGSTERLPHSNIFVGRQMAYVQDFDVEVAQFQAVADPVINVLLEGSAVDTAVSGELEYSFASDSIVIQNSLHKLTGEMPGRSAKAWLAWWEKHGAAWRSDERSRPKTG